MSDTDDDFAKAFKGFGEDEAPATSPAPPATPPATPPEEPPKDDSKKVDPPKVDPPKPSEEPPKDDEPAKPSEATTPPATDEKKKEDDPKPPETPETPITPETPQPLTKDDVQEVVSNLLNTERASGKELEATTQEVLEAYYPDGLSNVLTDERSGKELKTPQDVVDVSDGQMSTEEAAQWLMNEQYKLDQSVEKIKKDARSIAETTVKFKQDSQTVLQKYQALFKAYPKVQQEAWDNYKSLMKVDEKKNVILSAPDMLRFYDLVMDPYRLAFEHSTQQPATSPTAPETPAPPKPTAEDRMDEGGDGGTTPPDDPNDFPQQVKKELAKGI